MTGPEQQPARRKRLWPLVLAAAAGLIALLVAMGYLYNLHWQRKVDALFASYRAKGEPVTWEDVLAARERLPAEQNSALIFQVALAEIETQEDAPSVALRHLLSADKPGARPSERTLALLRAHVRDQAPVLAVIREGAKLETGVYPVAATGSPMGVLMPYLGPLRRAIGLSAMEAILRATDGDGAGAVEGLVRARRLCASLGECWMPVEVAIRAAGDVITVGAMQKSLGLTQLPPEGLSRLRHELAQEHSQVTTRHAWMYERAEGYYFFNQLSAEYLGMTARWNGIPTRVRLWSYRTIPIVMDRDAMAFYDVLARYAALGELSADEQVARLGKALREAGGGGMWLEGAPYWWPECLAPDFNGYLKGYVDAETLLRVADAALAVEQWRMAHGRWPDALDDLVPDLLPAVPHDPYGDGPIRYARTDGGVILYSVGPDGKDDGGLTEGEMYRPAPSESDERGDMPFRLLNPELRGAAQMTFSEEVHKSRLGAKELLSLGLTAEEIKALGVDTEGR